MARTMLIMDWAREELSEPIPCQATLIKDAKCGLISPPPFKSGRRWRIDSTARYVAEREKPVIKSDDNPRLKRILEDGSSP